MHDEMHILKEVGTIAAAHGGIALSEILKKKILLEVPHTQLITAAGVRDRINFERVGIAVYSKIVTGLNGQVIFLLDEKNAFRLNELSYKMAADAKHSGGVMTEMGMSVIKEIGSMVTSAYVTAIGMMFKKVILIGAPMLISGTMNEILGITVFSGMKEENQVLMIDASFSEPDSGIAGSFYMILTTEAAVQLQEICRKMLADIKKVV